MMIFFFWEASCIGAEVAQGTFMAYLKTDPGFSSTTLLQHVETFKHLIFSITIPLEAGDVRLLNTATIQIPPVLHTNAPAVSVSHFPGDQGRDAEWRRIQE